MVPLLLADGGSKTARVRYDFWRTVGELVSENFTGQILNWCQGHGIRSGGHLLMEEGVTQQVGLYGNFFACLRRLNAPGIDCLTSVPAEVPWQIARQASGAADLGDGGQVMCETSDFSQVYRPDGDSRPKRVVTESEIRGTCNKLMAAGISRITSYYSFDKLDAAALARINHAVAAVTSRMSGGAHAADVALVYPVESLWPRYVPSRLWAAEAGRAHSVENSYHAAAQQLYESAIDFTVIDSAALIESKPDGDMLRHGNLAWHVVVLPQVDTLPAAAWKQLEQWMESGGVVVALGALPANSDTDLPSPETQSMAARLFESSTNLTTIRATARGGAGVFLPTGMEWLLAEAIHGIITPDVEFHPAQPSLHYTHRRIDGSERYFVINDSAQPWSGEIAIRGAGRGILRRPEAHDPVSVNGSNAAVRLDAYEGAVLEFAESHPVIRKPAAAFTIPRIRSHPIASPQPTIGRGEFVRETVGADTAKESAGAPVWKAAGRIIKSGVDTHLFACFHYETPVNLGGGDAIAFDTWVPAGQRTASQLLVIVHERDGGDYYAPANRSLDICGRERVVVPHSAFQVAGWSSDPDGRMDWSKVTDIRLGWGGYYGTDGETVEFSYSPPASIERER
jgi:hypothetical protein